MEVIDNISNLLGDDLKSALKPGARLKIAASCFSIYAFEALKKELEEIESLEFVFTSPTFTPEEATDKSKKEYREFHLPKLKRERGFFGTEFEIQLKNQLTQRAIAKECADWIRRKAKFKSNTGKKPMQQFAGVVDDGETVYAPLHGFTAPDLGYQQSDAFSNLVNKFNEPEFTQKWLGTFEQVWDDQTKLQDVTDTLVSHIEDVYKENSPEKIYFLILYNIFNEFLEDITEDVLPNDLTGYKDSLIWNKLYNFQKDAATGIINKLETFNGCILADSVGLGKTFSALAVIKYYELRNKAVLVLCPKKLAENWTTFNQNVTNNQFFKDRFNYDVLCHTDLQRDSGESLGISLDRINWGNYDLVVIDESHNFRNNEVFKDKETRYQKLMNKVIKAGVKTKVLMLSATPVNNRFNDLKNQLALAYEGESSLINDKLDINRDVEEVFRSAQKAFNAWSKMEPEDRTAQRILEMLDFDFFKVLDAVTIARSRKHVTTFYDTTEIGSFPKRLKPKSIFWELTDRKDVIGFDEIFNHLTVLKLAVYTPVTYVLPSRVKKYEDMYDTEVSGPGGIFKQKDREIGLRALMTTNLLKRLESSVEAFRLTLTKLQGSHTEIIERIERHEKEGGDTKITLGSRAFEDAESEDDELNGLDESSGGGKIQISLSDMDLPSWKRDVQADLIIVDALLSEMAKVTPDVDWKLQDIKKHIELKIASPINEKNKKVLIFTAFADTAKYLYENLSSGLLGQQGVHSALVTGSDRPKVTLGKGFDFQTVLTLFSPKSKEKSLIMPDATGEIDIIIATDCISEGQNLQDCDYLINYDIHWNPVRIIQRFGRIDRIGSTNAVIQLVNYWPNISLDEYINLKDRVESRMVIADVTATGDDNVLSAKASDTSYRREQLRRLQEEVIEMEDVKTGVSITDLGLNDFRMDLLNYVKDHGDLSGLPNGMHAVVPENAETGLKPGVIFSLRNRNHSVNVNQQNRLHPYYMVYIGLDGDVLVRHTDVKPLLDLARSACKGRTQAMDVACKAFNKETKDGKRMDRYSTLLGQAIQSMIETKEEGDIDSLFTEGPTLALENTISGLNDFELIAFIVVQASGVN